MRSVPITHAARSWTPLVMLGSVSGRPRTAKPRIVSSGRRRVEFVGRIHLAVRIKPRAHGAAAATEATARPRGTQVRAVRARVGVRIDEPIHVPLPDLARHVELPP